MLRQVYAISDRPGVLLEIVPPDQHQDCDAWHLELVVVERAGDQIARRVIVLAHFTDEQRAMIAHRWLSDAFAQLQRAKAEAKPWEDQ